MIIVSKHTTKQPLLHTVSMFDLIDAARRDPEKLSQSEIVNVSQEHHFALQRATLPDGREMYAVQDWLSGVAKPSDVRVFWQQMKKRLKKSQPDLYTACIQLPYLASDGKNYKMDYADGQTLYGITQHMGVDTGIRNQVLTHLAKTGAFIDAARRDPEQAEIALNQHARQKSEYEGKDPSWILVREMGKVTRKQLTAIIVKLSPAANLGIVTNIGYQGVLGADARGLNAQLGQKAGANPRDDMSRLGLAYTMVHEEAVRVRLSIYGEDEIVPEDVVYREIREVAKTTGLQAREMADQLGIDLVTGQKRLGGGK